MLVLKRRTSVLPRLNTTFVVQLGFKSRNLALQPLPRILTPTEHNRTRLMHPHLFSFHRKRRHPLWTSTPLISELRPARWIWLGLRSLRFKMEYAADCRL